MHRLVQEVLKELDLGDVGDFIDLASTLVELKSRRLLPDRLFLRLIRAHFDV